MLSQTVQKQHHLEQPPNTDVMRFMSLNVKETVVQEVAFDLLEHFAQASGQLTTDDHCKWSARTPSRAGSWRSWGPALTFR